MELTTAVNESSLLEALIREEHAEDADEEAYIFILPVIICLGLLGNAISLFTIAHSRLRKMAANKYLVVLTLSDSVFLISLTGVLLKLDFKHYFYCLSIEYIMMATSYVSSWTTVGLTIERYMAVCHPLRHAQLGHVDRRKMLYYIVCIPFALHVFQFYNLVPNSDDPQQRKCVLRATSNQMLYEIADCILSFLAPGTVVVCLNLIVAARMHRAKDSPFDTPPRQGSDAGLQQQPLAKRLSAQAPVTLNPADADNTPLTAPIVLAPRRQGGASASCTSSVARILLVVPLVFCALNTPFFCIRLYEVALQHVFHSVQSVGDMSDTFIWAYNVSHYLYYLNFASDVVVYAFSSSNFRRTTWLVAREAVYEACTFCGFGANFQRPMASSMMSSARRSARYRRPFVRQATHSNGLGQSAPTPIRCTRIGSVQLTSSSSSNNNNNNSNNNNTSNGRHVPPAPTLPTLHHVIAAGGKDATPV